MDNQEEFWTSTFGDQYPSRNQSGELLAANKVFFQRALARIQPAPRTFLELGSNVGMNYLAIREVLPELAFTGVEINQQAFHELAKTGCKAVLGSVYDFETPERFEVAFTKGVLIHINPERLNVVYDKLYQYSTDYILVAEYYNPVPVEVDYRGHAGKLFKRDFAGELLDRFPDLTLIDYGFSYHRDAYPQDDISWFLLKKQKEIPN
jgi:pseudaminic acid biosynthesis-associated methylase